MLFPGRGEIGTGRERGGGGVEGGIFGECLEKRFVVRIAGLG